MKPNIKPMLRGSNTVPSTRPSEAIAMQDSGTKVTMIHQCRSRRVWTPDAWTTAAIGRTIAAEMMPWIIPESTFSKATSQIGHGACTRSSISRVKPNSCARSRATDWTPWNMIEIPTTPGTRIVANGISDEPPLDELPPIAWPIFGNTNKKTKHKRNGCISVRTTNSKTCLRRTTRSRSKRAPSAMREASNVDRVGCVETGMCGTMAIDSVVMCPAAPFR